MRRICFLCAVLAVACLDFSSVARADYTPADLRRQCDQTNITNKRFYTEYHNGRHGYCCTNPTKTVGWCCWDSPRYRNRYSCAAR